MEAKGRIIGSDLLGKVASVLLGITIGVLLLVNSSKGSLVILGSLVAVIVLLRPDVGLFLVIANLPVVITFGGFGPAVISPIKLLGLLTFASWLIHFAINKHTLVRAPQNWVIGGFIFLAFFSFIFAKDSENSLMFTATYLLNGVFYFLLVNIIDSEKRLNILMWILIFSVVVVAGIGIAQYFLKFHTSMPGSIARLLKGGNEAAYLKELAYWHGKMRVTGTQVEPNTLALILLMIVSPTAILLIREHSIALKILLGIVLSVLLLTIVFTFSRMAFLGLIVCFICVWVKVKAKAYIFIMVLIGLLIAIPFVPGQYMNRIKSITDVTSDPAIQSRLKTWWASLPVFRDHFFTGVGVGNFGLAVGYGEADFMGLPFEAHNTYLEVATEMGFIGFGFFIMAMFTLAHI